MNISPVNGYVEKVFDANDNIIKDIYRKVNGSQYFSCDYIRDADGTIIELK